MCAMAFDMPGANNFDISEGCDAFIRAMEVSHPTYLQFSLPSHKIESARNEHVWKPSLGFEHIPDEWQRAFAFGHPNGQRCLLRLLRQEYAASRCKTFRDISLQAGPACIGMTL